WSQPFYFDVTDYATVLKDSNKIRIHYSGYSGGFTANIRFAMIEGTPERDVKGVKTMWNASYSYGNTADPIDDRVASQTLTAPAGTASATYRMNITGHGSDATGCSEFCQKYYKVIKDGNPIKETLIWRDNCGYNNLYPQNGTWIYDRGNWCPGDLVHTIFHPIPGVTDGSTFNLGLSFEPYTSSGGASYTVFGSVIYFGPMNKKLDASLEDIIAPTTNENHYRANPSAGRTIIRVRNTGSTPIKNIDYEYGVTGQPLTKINWSTNIPPLTDSIIELPNNASLFAASGSNIPYEVNIIKVNGETDEDLSNNKAVTTFNAAPVWPSKINITLLTNKGVAASGFSQTEWVLLDDWENVVSKRVNNSPEKEYKDTLTLKDGIYKLIVTDAGCNGLNWWAASAEGGGSFAVRNGLFVISTPGYFGGDFGCGFTQEFRIGTPSVSISERNAVNTVSLSVYPNPASDAVTVDIAGLAQVKGLLQITDNTGRVVATQQVSESSVRMATGRVAAGLYFVNFIPERADVAKTSCKLLIAQ
ncbi:MAG: T9SS type A sorting domain-containing protein, partial [Chitinophagaceae bacterium]|nr:T9SS type A sorting domain-containing protein [Chitinophagaceae bacterium]